MIRFQDIKPSQPIIEHDRWRVREMVLYPDKIEALWKMLSEHATLFSDFTRGDYGNFLTLLGRVNTYCLEIADLDNYIIGLAYFEGFDGSDTSGHLVFFDRRPAEKEELCALILKYVFDKFMLHRISALTPEIYFRTNSLLKRLGFKLEGTKREAVLLGGKWKDVSMFGLLRGDLENVVSVRPTENAGHVTD